MPRNWSKAVLEGNGPVPQQEEFGPDHPTLANFIDFLKKDSIDNLIEQRVVSINSTN